MSGIMAVFGVTVSIVIIAAGGGDFAESGLSLFNPPNTSNLWKVGNNIHDGTILNYSLTRIGGHGSPWGGSGGNGSLVDSVVSIKFTQDINNDKNWRAIINVINGTETKGRQDTVSLSKEQLTNAGPVSQIFKPYYGLVESSVLEIREIAEGQQYLTIGAQWNSITGEVTTIPVKITAQEKIHINSLTFDAHVLSYTLGSRTSKIWIAQDIPLPIKAELYNAYNQLQYEYELVSYRNDYSTKN
jgi:hypothetical protein